MDRLAWDGNGDMSCWTTCLRQHCAVSTVSLKGQIRIIYCGAGKGL